MHFLINEQSFIGQGTNYTVPNLLLLLAETIDSITPILCGDSIHRHSNLANRYATPQLTLHDCLFQIRDPRLQARRVFLLTTLTKGPHIDTLLSSIPHHCKYNGKDVTSSSLAGAAYFNGALISLNSCPQFAAGLVPLDFAHGSNLPLSPVTVTNIITPAHASGLRRYYKASPKHGRRGWGTFMDIEDDQQAQQLLDCGEQGDHENDKQIYNLHAGKFYEFQPDNADYYHGYPVPEEEVPAEVVRRLSNRPPT